MIRDKEIEIRECEREEESAVKRESEGKRERKRERTSEKQEEMEGKREYGR